MTAPAFVTVSDVRDYIRLVTNNPTGNSQYTDQTIGSNIRAASSRLEQETHRWFSDRPTTTFTTTSNGRPVVYIPGFRTITGVTIQTAPLISGTSFWAIPDQLGSGIYVALQLRAFTMAGRDPARAYLANPNWFDVNADSPWYPGNYGGGYGGLPNDVVVSGDGGYLDADLPEPLRHATKVLASFYTMRPASILADVSITPQGGVVNASSLPAEVRDFIREWSIGEQAVVVG